LQWLGGTSDQNSDIDVAQKKAYELLYVFENHLRDRSWLECDRATIADIACFPTLRSAADGKALDAYPNVVVWIERLSSIQAMSARQDCREKFVSV